MELKDKQKEFDHNSQTDKFYKEVAKTSTPEQELSTRANAEATEGYTKEASSNGGPNPTTQDEYLAIEIANGSKKSEVTLKAKRRLAGNYYGVSAETFDGDSIQKALDKRKEALETAERVYDSKSGMYVDKEGNQYKHASRAAAKEWHRQVAEKARKRRVQYRNQQFEKDAEGRILDSLNLYKQEKIVAKRKYLDDRGDEVVVMIYSNGQVMHSNGIVEYDASYDFEAQARLEAAGQTQTNNVIVDPSINQEGNTLLAKAQRALEESESVLGSGLSSAYDSVSNFVSSATDSIIGGFSSFSLTQMVDEAQEKVRNDVGGRIGASIGELAGNALFGNDTLLGQLGIKILSFVGRWALGNCSLLELATAAIADWWDNLQVINIVVDTIGKVTGLPATVINKVTKYAKLVWDRGLDPKEIFKAFQSITIDEKSIQTPELSLNFDTSNIGAMIKSAFAAGLAPLEFVNNIMVKIESILNNKILILALNIWMILKPNTGAETILELTKSINRSVVWARSKLNTIMTKINSFADKIVQEVDNLIKQALGWLLNMANVGLSKLQPLLAMLPFDSSIILKSVLSMFSLNHVIEITYKANGITESDLVKCGFGNQQTNKALEEQGKEPTSNTQYAVKGGEATPTTPQKIESKVYMATDGAGNPRSLNISLPEWTYDGA